MHAIPVPEPLVRLRGAAIKEDILNVCLTATATDRELFVLGSLFYRDDGFENALFVSRFDATMKLVDQTLLAREFNPTGIFVEKGKPLVTLFDNRVVDGESVSAGPYLRAGDFCVVRTSDNGGASGPCGSSIQGTFVLTRASFEVVRTIVEGGGRACEHPTLVGSSSSPPIFARAGGLEVPHQFWMYRIDALPGRGALLTVLSGKGSKGWPCAYVIVDDRGEVVRALDLDGDSPYDKIQITPVVDPLAKKIVIKTARAVHVFDFDGARQKTIQIDSALAAWRAIAWLDGFVLFEPKKRAIVRADDASEHALGLVKSQLKKRS